MIIIAIILSTSDDITKNSGINNGGWIPFLHVTALGRVYAIKTQLSNKFKEIQIAPRFAKHINETSQEVVGNQIKLDILSTLFHYLEVVTKKVVLIVH
jgi:hypothetical protein